MADKMRNSSFLTSMGWFVYAALAFSLLMTVGCAGTPAQTQASQNQVGQNQASQNQEPKVVSQEESQAIAVEFLRNGPTFRYDGIENTLKLVRREAGEKPYRWLFHYEFQSRHAGYGDRTGMILAQVITDHRAEIVVEQGEVVHAVLDGRWDELRQRAIE